MAISSEPPAAKTGQLTNKPLHQQSAHRIIRRRAKAAGIETRIGNHTFRATGITAYLENSEKLEAAQQIANRRGRPSSATVGMTKSRSIRSSALPSKITRARRRD
jgi:integrase